MGEQIENVSLRISLFEQKIQLQRLYLMFEIYSCLLKIGMQRYHCSFKQLKQLVKGKQQTGPYSPTKHFPVKAAGPIALNSEL